MIERFEIGIADGAKQFLEAALPANFGAQHEGVGEHTDEVVELRLTSTCDG